MLSGQQDTTASNSITLTGKVLDAHDEKPIAGAIVQIDGKKSTTSGDGTYSIEGLKPGFLTARVEASGYRTHTETFEIPDAGTYSKNFYLVKKKTKVLISVLDDYSEKPIRATIKIDGKSYRTDESGMVEVLLPEGTYRFTVIPHENLYTKKSVEATVSGRVSVVKITLLPTKINLGDLKFESGKAEIKDYMIPRLEEACNILKRYSNARIIVEGHTDTRGSASYNLKLSKERAEAVKNWLVEHGCVNPDRIEARGYGESRPLVYPEKRPEDYAKNRRVVIRIIMPED